MKKLINKIWVVLLLFIISNSITAQSVEIGPRLTGNLNIYNEDRIAGTWNGVGIGIGGTVDISFSQSIGLITNLTFFDMRNFSNVRTNNNVTTEYSFSLAYITIDPLFKAEFSGFYLVGGFSVGIKISSSGEMTQSAPNRTPLLRTTDPVTNTLKFDLALGTGYNFQLTPTMALAPDFMIYIPLTDTYDIPGTSNSILTLKLGASLKFRL
ncbi:hypothetical protein MNBD_IGNAVI01-100 [hydrothermal vent metagenome]|uniref:Outer membrane protein beta-barrel domain-containing protein n=1 Tax=hydrothermal vent metagenome TaxID=652676 RepID=A0A3B1CM50_9ZZZZ